MILLQRLIVTKKKTVYEGKTFHRSNLASLSNVHLSRNLQTACPQKPTGNQSEGGSVEVLVSSLRHYCVIACVFL